MRWKLYNIGLIKYMVQEKCTHRYMWVWWWEKYLSIFFFQIFHIWLVKLYEKYFLFLQKQKKKRGKWLLTKTRKTNVINSNNPISLSFPNSSNASNPLTIPPLPPSNPQVYTYLTLVDICPQHSLNSLASWTSTYFEFSYFIVDSIDLFHSGRPMHLDKSSRDKQVGRPTYQISKLLSIKQLLQIVALLAAGVILD